MAPATRAFVRGVLAPSAVLVVALVIAGVTTGDGPVVYGLAVALAAVWPFGLAYALRRHFSGQ